MGDPVHVRRTRGWRWRVGARCTASRNNSATTDIPRTGEAPAVSSLDTVTLRKYRPTEVATKTRVVTVKRTGAALALTTAWDNPVDAFREIMRLGAGSSLLDVLRAGSVT